MKRYLSLFVAASLAVVLCSGCSSLIPKRVELFQKKVKEFPVAKPKEVEVQRQAAELAAQKAEQTYVAAVKEDCSTNVVAPASQTAELTQSVSTSLGPPLKPWEGEVHALAVKLDSTKAQLNTRIDSFKDRNDDLAGKKIEDTGLVKVPYFVWLGGALIGFILLIVLAMAGFTALKVYGISNPIVGMGVGAVEGIATRGFKQVVAGGEKFLEAAKDKYAPEVYDELKKLFVSSHERSQDTDVQTTVQNLKK